MSALSTNVTSRNAPSITLTEALALLIANALFIAIHVPICIATYRVSRKTSTFILFFSETLANTIALFCSVTVAQIIVLIMGSEAAHQIESRLVLSLPMGIAAYPSLALHLLIAVNRAFSVIFPLHYSGWWTRGLLLYSTLSAWVIGISIKAGEAIAAVLMASGGQNFLQINGIAAFNAVYSTFQPPITYSCLALYGISLVWVMARRLVGSGGGYWGLTARTKFN